MTDPSVPPPPGGQLRPSDAERQAVADRLRAALDEGRLDLHEYDHRVRDAYAAMAYDDLDRLLVDLPGGAGDEGPVVAYLGDISVTSTTVHTPAGPIPLRGSQWTVTDQWLAQQRTPTWAVLAAIFGFCFIFLFSLLFLLAKETVYQGTVQVMVTNGRHQYVARIPVASQAQVQYLHQQANYVRSLAAL